MTTSDDIKELAAALVKVQRELKPAKRESTNPNFGTTYADLAMVTKSCRVLLARHQMAVFQDAAAGRDDGMWQVDITTMLVHAPSGQWVRGNLTIPTLPDAQGVGKAITYGRRFHLATMVGVVAESEDDDGNAISPPRDGVGGMVRSYADAVPGAMETTRLRVSEVLKVTKRKFRPYFRFRMSDGNIYGTHQDELAQALVAAGYSGYEQDVTWKQVWETREVQAIEAVPIEQQATETPL